MTSKLIACELHDYLEIACMYQYRVRLFLKNRTILEGKAVDVASREQQEYLILEADGRQSIDLGELDKLQVLTPNAKFTEVAF